MLNVVQIYPIIGDGSFGGSTQKQGLAWGDFMFGYILRELGMAVYPGNRPTRNLVEV